ncbi:hypothetical protein ACLOJK_002965 [Asimina triloba]
MDGTLIKHIVRGFEVSGELEAPAGCGGGKVRHCDGKVRSWMGVHPSIRHPSTSLVETLCKVEKRRRELVMALGKLKEAKDIKGELELSKVEFDQTLEEMRESPPSTSSMNEIEVLYLPAKMASVRLEMTLAHENRKKAEV